RALVRQRGDGGAVGAAVDAVRSEVLDDQLHVAAAGERGLPGGEQEVDPLAVDRAADEQEPGGGGRVELQRRPFGSEPLEVDAIGHHVHPIGLDTGAQVHVAYVGA